MPITSPATVICESSRVAVETDPVTVDVGRAGDRAFMNVATGGFGTEVTQMQDNIAAPAKGNARMRFVHFAAQNAGGLAVLPEWRRNGVDLPGENARRTAEWEKRKAEIEAMPDGEPRDAGGHASLTDRLARVRG